MDRIGVVGGGSWGTALADLLAKKGYKVDLWVFEEDLCERMAKFRENDIYLPGITLSENIFPKNILKDVCLGKDLILVVVPTRFLRKVLEKARPFIKKGTKVVSATKGIENETLKTPSGIIQEILDFLDQEDICVISGPSFAKEVALKIPTSVVLACISNITAERIRKLFSTSYFKLYVSFDIVGAELGGALKNVIAIATGISDGMGLGHNTRAAVITRGLYEIASLGIKMGANPLTFLGLSGLGDLVLTCTSELSRNRTVGLRMGMGDSLDEILCDMKMVAEGVHTAKSAYKLSLKFDVKMPIVEQVYRVIYEGSSPKDVVKNLMLDGFTHELDPSAFGDFLSIRCF